MTTNEIFLYLLRSELFEQGKKERELLYLSEDQILSLFKTAKIHDLAHIIYHALSKVLRDKSMLGKYEKAELIASYRYEQMIFQYERICKALSDAKIGFVPLKGAVIRNFYPEPQMRTSCDIDILVREDDVEEAIRVISENLGYKAGAREFHDVSLYSDTGVHLELHFNILENLPTLDKVLGKAWDYVTEGEDGSSQLSLAPEFLIFHTVAHMAYHFAFGGCGVRPFIDLYLILRELDYDKEKLAELMREAELERFYAHAKKLSLVWLEGAEGDETVNEMAEYILSGSLYGTKEIGAAAAQVRNGGKTKYVLRRIFQPYNVLKEKYPIIKKHPYLTPIYEVKRWGDIVFKGKLKKSVDELKTTTATSDESARQLSVFLKKVGLK